MSLSRRSPTIKVSAGEMRSFRKRTKSERNTCGLGLANPWVNEKKQSSGLKMEKGRPTEPKAVSSSRNVCGWQFDARPRSTSILLKLDKSSAAYGNNWIACQIWAY